MTNTIARKVLTPVGLNEIRQRLTDDGVVYPLQVFDDNVFMENGYAEKYKTFRREIHKRTLSSVCNTQCKKGPD